MHRLKDVSFFHWCMFILYRVHECDMSDFNFYVDENGKHNYDEITFPLAQFYFAVGF